MTFDARRSSCRCPQDYLCELRTIAPGFLRLLCGGEGQGVVPECRGNDTRHDRLLTRRTARNHPASRGPQADWFGPALPVQFGDRSGVDLISVRLVPRRAI